MKDPFLLEVLKMAAVDGVAEQPATRHWDALESSLGVLLPLDFKDLVNSVGTGGFGELTLLNPASPNKYVRFDARGAEQYRRDISPRAEEAGLLLYPEPRGFLRVGIADNRMDLLMRPQPGDKESDRLVWLDQDYARVHSFNMTVAHFLHDLYLGILPGAWAQETRALLWEPREPLFKPWEGPKL